MSAANCYLNSENQDFGDVEKKIIFRDLKIIE